MGSESVHVIGSIRTSLMNRILQQMRYRGKQNRRIIPNNADGNGSLSNKGGFIFLHDCFSPSEPIDFSRIF